MTESKVSSSSAFSPRAKKASVAENESTLQNGDMAGDIRSFEFDECSGNSGVVLENKDPGSPSRARTALGNIRIADLLPGSRAKQDGLLEVGDRVLEINGRDLSKASLERARWYLGSAVRSGKLRIKVLRGLTESNITPRKNSVVPTVEMTPETSRPKNRVKKIHILKDSRGLGVQILMKLNHETGEKGVFVSDVSPGGAAARDGRLKEGDELLWINGHSLIGVTQQEAVDLLRASPKLIQLVISIQGSESSLEKKVPGTPSKDQSLENVSRRAAMQGTRNLPRAPSTENLLHKGRKMSSDHMEKKSNMNHKHLEKATAKSNGPALQQSVENGPSKKADHNLVKDSQIKVADLLDESHNEQNHVPFNGNASELTNGRCRSSSSSSDSSNGPAKSNTGDVLLSKGEESLESEPVTLEDKPLSTGSTTKASTRKLPSPPVIDASKKRHSPNPLLNTPTSKDKPSSNGTCLEPGQISPSLPRPQSPGGMGIAFSARYLGDPPSNVMTIAMPTPRNLVGSNERDSPQAKTKWSNESSQRRTSKAMEEEIVTIVLVKGMSGKGLGFTIVGGKGSPHGDMAVYIKSILSGGAAEADGRMKKGDEVLSVNGTSFEGFTHQEALDTFKNLRRGIVTLKVRRNSPGAPSVSTFTTPRSSPGSSRRNSKDVTAESSCSSSNSSSPTMFRKLRQKRSQKEKITEIVLYKEPGNSLGIGLGEQHPSTRIPGVFVQCVIQGTPAAHDGRLRQGDQLLEINDMKLEGKPVENIYSILDKVPPGKVYIKVVQSNASDKLPLRLNDELTKLQSEQQVLDKKVSGKSKSVGTASTLSGASGSSESCENMTSLSSSCDPLIPLAAEPNKKKKSQALRESDDDVFTNEPDSAEYLEDIYTIIKQPTGGLGMGVTIDKSRGNTIAEGVSIKSVTEGGSAALARSPRGVGLKLGDQIVEVNGTHLRGMDQEDVIKIFRDLPSSTQMKIRRSKMAPQELDSAKTPNKRKESFEKTATTQDPVPLPKPPESRRRSSQRGKLKPVTQEDKTSSPEITDGMALSERVEARKESGSPVEEYASEKIYHNGIKVAEKSQDQERTIATDGGEQSTTKSPFTKQVKPVLKDMDTSKDLKNKTSDKLKDELGDNLFIPSGYRKMTITISKGANSTLGLSLVPSYGNLKGFFQIRRLQSGMVCAQDGQLHIGDKLVSVNGVSLKGVTHSMALQLLKKPMELVTFVILREGVEPQRRVSSPSSQSKSDSSSGQNSAAAQKKGIISEPLFTIKTEQAEKLPRCEKPVPPIKSQRSIYSEKLDKRSESHSTSSEDGNAEEDVPKVPCTPPPSPLVGVDHLLDSDLSVLPPSFSPPPPPELAAFPSLGDEDVSLSAIPVVSPPPDLSPRMKEFLEKDPFSAADHQENNSLKFTHDDEILPESSSTLNQASSPGSEAVAGWDFQSLLDACNDLNTYENDNVFTSERTSITETPSVTGDSKPKVLSVLSTETKNTKENNLQKRLETSIGSPAVENRNDVPCKHSKSQLSRPGFGERDKGLRSTVEEHNTKDLTTPPKTTEHKLDDDVKPVAGRRVENVPFVITYQKKFRSLGVKVDLTEEGEVIVSDVSSFGLVGKDGNIRVGDVLLSINDTSLEGMAPEDVQNMIKNCPRGDVRIVAQAGPKQPKPTEAVEETVFSPDLKERGQLDDMSDKNNQAGRETVPDVLSNVAVHKPRVDMPSELTSQKNTDTSGRTVPNLFSSNKLPDTRGKVSSAILPQDHTDDFTTTEECEGIGLESTDFDDLPPSIPPPPIPANDLQVEDYSGDVDEPLVQDIVQDVSFNPPTNFEDFVDDKIESALSYDSEEEACRAPPKPLRILGRAAQPHGPSTVQTKDELSRKTDVPSGSGQTRKMPAEDIQPQIPIKPPSLFGDDTESESVRPDAPQKLVKNSSVEDAAVRESSQWNGLEDSPIKPPSLFDDELESLPSLPSAPPPPKLSKHFISLDTVSSTSSSPLQSPRFDRESLNHSPSTQRSNFSAESGSSSPSHGRGSTLGIPDPFSDMPIQPPYVVDDDMSSLPPAPPPPRSPVNRSSSWSVRSDTSAPLQHGNAKVPHITSPLPKPAKPERKNSKKRILPLRIRSKRGRKTSEQSDSSYVTDGHRELSPQGFVAPIISSDVNQPTSLTHVEPPEDDMESLPPAPPPPRMSPLTVESLESIADGLQPVKVKTTPSRSVSEERRAITPTGVAEPLHSSQQSPKKKKKSFRRNVIQMEAEGSLPEYGGSSVNVPVVPEMDRAVDNSLKHLTPLEDEVAVTDSSDAMSPPPLPPQMELWSEAGAAEAELALLDQILTLEDSSRSGNEQSSEDGTSSSTKPTSFSTELSYVDTKSMESKEGSANNKSKEARYIMTKEGSSDTNITTSSLEELADMDSRGIPELEPVNLNSSVNATGANVESEAYSPVVDLQERKTSDTVHQKPSGRLLKQLSEGGDPAGNLIKHRRPAPPIPARPSANSKASTVPRKSLPGGIPVLPSRPDIKPKATPSPHEPTPNHHRDQQRLSSPVKEKTSRKLFSRSHKGKDKRADSNNLESPDTSFNSNPEGRERSRSWTKKLFGFRSRSRSKNRDKSKDLENRSRSVSPPRGFFSRSRRSSPPLPPATTKKDPLSKHKKEIERKDPVIDDIERYIPVEETPVLSQTLPSTFRLSDPSSQIRNHVEGNNNKFGSPTTGDGDSSPEVEGSILNFQPRTDVSLTVPDETYRDESQFKNVDLNHEEKESESDIQGTSLLSDDEYVTTPDAHFGVDASLTNRPLPPLPPQREKHPDATALITADNDKENAVEDKLPMKPPYKPPVPKRPEFLKSVSTPSRQQQETMDELKQKINKASSSEDRLETAPDMTEDTIFNTEVDDMPDSDDLPSPGPPTFTPVPPPLTLGTSSSPVEKDDSNKTARCPNSPGPPRFKPPPPPLSLKAIAVQNDVTSDETLDSPISPGPPKFKPAPPPIDLQFQNKNIDSEEQDVPRTADIPNIKPLPPIPVAGKMQRQEDPFSAERIVMEGTSVEGDAVPALQNDERRKTKPLPPIPTSFNLKTKDNSHKLPLSRQDAQECDNKEDVDNPEMSEQNPEPPLPQVTLSEDNNYSQVSQVVEPDITQDATHEMNASNIDDLDSSELSSEWDDTCSSTQGDSGQPGAGSKFARSASFSAGDVHIQRPPVVDEQTKRPTPATMRPPPFMRRRSSSLPHLFQDSLTGEASEGRAGETDYWHTGNLQQLINSRNQEPDVDEGIIEVQLLKEQQSIGLMVVGGLDTHLGMLYIKDIQPNSPAANCNRLRVGDQLLQVNDSCLVGVTHGEALNILKNTPPLVKLTVARKKDGDSDGLELVAEGRRVTDAEEPIVSAARESSTISKTASELPVSPPPDRGQRPKSLVSLSSFGTSFNNDPSPVSPCGSFDESDDYVPAYLEPESPTLTLGQDDVPVTIIDGIPGENDSTTTEEEEEMKPFSKSVSWAVSSDDTKVFTVELFKNGRAGLGLSVSGGVDTAYDDIMVRQILSNSVTAHNGHIKKGDILLSVNGKSFKGLTNSEALTLLKDTPERVTLVVSRPLGHKQHSKAMTLLRNKNTNKEIISDSEAWPTREELAKKKNLANTNSNTPPTLEKIPLDVAKQNGEHSTFDRLKKRFFSNGGPMNLKERLHKVPQGPSVTEITLEKGASGLGFSLGGGQDSLYGDAPIHVRYVFKESVAGRSGALKPGDEILEVNGQKVAYMTNVDVLELIRRLPYGPVVMKIRRK